MDEQRMIDHIVSTSADIASIKTTLEQTLAPLKEQVAAQETRLGAVESDVKVWRKVFIGLWLLIAAAGTWGISWFKG